VDPRGGSPKAQEPSRPTKNNVSFFTATLLSRLRRYRPPSTTRTCSGRSRCDYSQKQEPERGKLSTRASSPALAIHFFFYAWATTNVGTRGGLRLPRSHNLVLAILTTPADSRTHSYLRNIDLKSVTTDRQGTLDNDPIFSPHKEPTHARIQG
jgi:hypothetical protein